MLEPLVDNCLLAVEVHEPLERQGIADRIAGHVLEGLRVVRRYRLADVC